MGVKGDCVKPTKMRRFKLLTVSCALATAFLGLDSVRAADSSDPGVLAADALIARPACLIATFIGSAIFVVTLPIAATSRSIHRSARALVVKPASATFTRPLGDLDSLTEDY